MNKQRYGIDIDGLEEEVRCAICKNPMHTDRGCDGGCQYDESLFKTITNLLDRRIQLVPIDPEPKWIPISKEPEEDEVYLATFRDSNGDFVDTCDYDSVMGWGFYPDDGDDFMPISNVIAYMPMPEPYKGVTE